MKSYKILDLIGNTPLVETTNLVKNKNVKLVDMNFTHKLTGIPVGMLHVMNMNLLEILQLINLILYMKFNKFSENF